MAVIKKSEFKKMTHAEMKKKIIELNAVLLELEGEGKRDKRKPVKRAIAHLNLLLSQEKGLNKSSEPKTITKK